MKNLSSHLSKNPQLQQSGQLNGIYKGIVVDVQDPAKLGRVRVWSYPLHGDIKGVAVEALPWAEFILPQRGAFCPAELNDRVVFSFESGDKYVPIVLGYWKANPVGQGELPYSKQVGSEVRPEGRHYRGLYPESNVVASSGHGNTISFSDKMLSDSVCAGDVSIVDIGGKLLRARSFDLEANPYSAKDSYTGKVGGIMDGKGDANKALRDGSTKAKNLAGSIDFQTNQVSRSLITDKDSFTVDQMVQYDDNQAPGVMVHNVAGEISRTSIRSNVVAQSPEAISLISNLAVMAMPLFTPPRIY